jgi:hypothetical protein
MGNLLGITREEDAPRMLPGITARFQELYAAEQETYKRDNPDHLQRALLEKEATRSLQRLRRQSLYQWSDASQRSTNAPVSQVKLSNENEREWEKEKGA